jgi:hypothetical protein
VSNEPCTAIRTTLRRGARLLCLALLSTLFTETPVLGQQETIDSPYRWREKGLRVGLWGAYHNGNRGNLGFGQGPAAAAGAKFRARVSSPISFEAGLTYGWADKWVIDPREVTGPVAADTVSAGWLRLDIGAQIAFAGSRTWHGFQPYGIVGGGWVFGINEGASPVFGDPALEPFRYEINTAPHVFLGLGTEVFASEKIGIGFEVRNHFIRQKAPQGFLLPSILAIIEEAGAPAPTATAWLMNFEFGISLWYYF